MSNGLFGLRHNTIISSDNQNHDISTLGTACTHRGKCCVPWGIQETDHAVSGFYMVGTNVLGNTAGLALRNTRLADVVQQRGLAMVYVAHNGHDRCARL